MMVQRNKILLFLLLSVAFLNACFDGSGFSDEPSISFVSFSKDTLIQAQNGGVDQNVDSILIVISFRDGDGDLGDDQFPTVRLVDQRTNITEHFRIPEIPRVESADGIEGEITIEVKTTCCIYEDSDLFLPCNVYPEFPSNTLSYEIFLVDRADNQSNVITTPPITLLCN